MRLQKDVMCFQEDCIMVSPSAREATLTPDGLFQVACHTLGTVPAAQSHQTATALMHPADFWLLE